MEYPDPTLLTAEERLEAYGRMMYEAARRVGLRRRGRLKRQGDASELRKRSGTSGGFLGLASPARSNAPHWSSPPPS